MFDKAFGPRVEICKNCQRDTKYDDGSLNAWIMARLYKDGVVHILEGRFDMWTVCNMGVNMSELPALVLQKITRNVDTSIEQLLLYEESKMAATAIKKMMGGMNEQKSPS